MASKTITFNILDWYQGDEVTEEDNDYKDKQYVIRLFGRTKDDKSVVLKVENFTPYFYIDIPDDWTKDIVDLFFNKLKMLCANKKKILQNIIKYEIVERRKFYGFTANKNFKFIRFIFNNATSMRLFSYIFTYPIDMRGIEKYKRKFTIYESNIDPYLRFMHIKDLNAAGWCSVNNYKINIIDETCCNINIKCDWKDVNKEDIDSIAPFKICSFDIECTSGDGSFPQSNRDTDKIIQIGSVFSKYGSNEIYKKHIITLGSCDPIDGVIVESYKTEREVLEAWQKLIIKEDPDILTGYNIHFFDEKYMYDRANYNNCTDNFYKLSKLIDNKCDFKEIQLSSSALGDNILRFINTIGRVQIDLMKVVQRDFKLDSWKLDSVAKHFIKETITNIEFDNNIYIIKSANTNSVQIGNYISVEEDGETFEQKLKIIDIKDNSIYASSDLNIIINKDKKLCWGLVKDDLHVNELFSKQKGSSADRKVIAQYCIQDCVLVSKLMAKLEIIVNNISMANVCSVPITYLFFRGQGIKSLSLVSKECRLTNVVIPVVKKDVIKHNNDEEVTEDVINNLYKLLTLKITEIVNEEQIKILELEQKRLKNPKKKVQWEDIDRITNIIKELNSGYEGATVFDPEIGYHKSPKCVLDFNSLYPSSIICKNISHETLVMFNEYDNLPNYTYFIVEYKDKNNKINTCKYAINKDGTPGILPNILQKLLTNRKLTKKQMDKETDPFKKTILDGKQLALKVTANSLYGQLGAETSPIFLKELAASTTAVGRNMLELASNFIELDFPIIFKSLFDNKNNFDHIINKELDDKNNTEFINMMMNTVTDIYTNNYEISPQEVITKIESIKGPTKIIHNNEYIPIYRIFSNIPPYISIGKRIIIDKSNTIKYIITLIDIDFFEVGIKKDTLFDIPCYRHKSQDDLKWSLSMVIYGDSVTSYTPIYIRDMTTLQISVCTIDNISTLYGNNNWIQYNDKESCELNNVETWSDKGWTKLPRIIRHILASHKKIIRVLTHTGVIDVTDDHSLLDKNSIQVTTKELNIGSEILHNNLPIISELTLKTNFTEEQAEIMGFFFGDGSCGYYNCKSGKKASFALNNANDTLLNKYKILCNKAYPEYTWVILSTIKSSGVNKLVPQCNKKNKMIVSFVMKYREMMYYNKSKIIPSAILHASLNIRKAFWRGLYDADGDKDINTICRIDQKSQISASYITLLADTLGYSVSINTRKDKHDIFRMTMTKNNQRINPNIIKKMYEIPYSGFVYDLTTDNHHFAAGVGRIIVHNTDSAFFRTNICNKKTKEMLTDKKALQWTINIGEIISKLLKIRLPKPQNMEYEKTFYPFCILAKKKYVGNKYTTNVNKCYQASMGIVLKRRDNANIVKKFVRGVIDLMMNDMDNDKIIKFVKISIKNLLSGKYPMTDFITSKTLKSSYKVNGELRYYGPDGWYYLDPITFQKNYINFCPVNLAHVMLATRMADRDPGNKPQSNDRIQFAIVEKFPIKGQKLLQGDIVEHPDFIKQHNLNIDYLFYLTNQIMNPVLQFIDLIIDDANDIFNKYINIERIKQDERKCNYFANSQNLDQIFQDRATINERKRIDDNKTMNNNLKNNQFFKITSSNDNDDWEIEGPNMMQLIKDIKNNKNIKITKKKVKKIV